MSEVQAVKRNAPAVLSTVLLILLRQHAETSAPMAEVRTVSERDVLLG